MEGQDMNVFTVEPVAQTCKGKCEDIDNCGQQIVAFLGRELLINSRHTQTWT